MYEWVYLGACVVRMQSCWKLILSQLRSVKVTLCCSCCRFQLFFRLCRGENIDVADDDHRSYIANEFAETSAKCGDAFAAVVIVVVADFLTTLSVWHIVYNEACFGVCCRLLNKYREFYTLLVQMCVRAANISVLWI